mgnify:CR=1 FL=1
MKQRILVENGQFKRVEYTLMQGETLPSAVSTKRCYKGPGKVVREFYPDGCINDLHDEDTCRSGWTAAYLTKGL